MMARRARFVVMLLLVISSFAAMTASTNLFTPVHAAPFLILTPNNGPVGTDVKVSGNLPGGGGDSQCSIVSGTSNSLNPIVPNSQACAVNGGGSTTGNFTGSFTVASVPAGQYVIQVNGNNGGPNDFVQAVFSVTLGAQIHLSPGTGQPGTHILVNGTGFLPQDNQCSLASPSSAGVILFGTAACVIRAGTGIVNASFTIGNVLPGQYVIQVTGTSRESSPDFAQALLNVVSGPAIKLSPGTGQPGTHIAVNGTGFLPTDTSCSISSPSPSVILAGTAGCAIRVGSGIVNASFIIGNALPGQYVIEVTACGGNNGCAPSAGDFAQAVLNVVSGPGIKLSPGGGRTGAHISVNGTGFLPTDTSCSLASPSSASVILPGSAACVIRVGTGLVNASFIIGSVPPSQYVIEVTACSGNNGCLPSVGDFAQAVLNVLGGPQISLSPGTGQPGSHVLVNGTGFLPTDNVCFLTSPSSIGVILSGTAACVVRAGTGIVNASFTIGNVLPGQYIIEVDAFTTAFVTTTVGTTTSTTTSSTSSVTTTTTTSQTEFAQALLNVVSGPAIRLSPATGPPGAHVLVNGTGFLPTDTQCTLASPSSLGVILFGTAGCVIRAGSGLVNASFTIGNVLPGQYVIQVNGNTGDSAQALLNVVLGPAVRLSPATGQPGTHVSVNGTGFLPTDASCSLASPSSLGVILFGTAGCVIRVGTGLVNASFIIGNVLPGQYVIEVTACGGNNGCLPSQGDFAQAVLNVVSGPGIKLSPASARDGAHISVNGTGFLPTDTSCSLASPSGNVILLGTQACVIKVGTGLVNASFTVGNALPGEYVIEVTACGGNNGCQPSVGDFAQAVFDVVGGPSLFLSPATGQPGSHILANGTGFLPTDIACALTSPVLPSPILTGTAACVIRAGTGLVNASFTIGNVLPGQYVIQVFGDKGDSATAILNVVSGPAIKLSPATGQPGSHILVNGTGFLPTDVACAVTSPSSASVILSGTAACVIRAGSGLVNASFTIGNVLPGQYVIQVFGDKGDSATAILNVVSGPSIKLSPATGQPGTHVSVNGTGFLPTDQSCSVSSISLDSNGHGPIAPGTAGCVIRVGSGVVNASFTIGNVLPGQYVIEVTGCGGNNGCAPSVGDFATAILNVVGGPGIKLSPATGSPGSHILVNGTGFLPTDTSCSLGSPSSVGVILAGTAACVIKAGTGLVNASFTIGNVLPGQYVIQVTGNQGDSAQAILNVVNGPRLTLSPGTGTIGQEILVNGTGFLPTDQSCSISSPSTPNPILLGSAGCVIAVGTGIVNGSFIIGAVAPGQYVIEVTGCGGNNGCAPSVGDFAQAVLNVKAGASEIDLFPTNATTGATVVVRAYGLSPSDTGCIILAFSGDITPVHQDNTLITSPTCSVVSTQTAQGTFVVGPYATEDIHWNVTVKGTPANDLLSNSAGLPIGAPFGVTAQITVVPTSGTINSVFTYTGTGFESDARFCNATVIPSFNASTVKPSCAIDPFGQVSGSVLVPRTAIAGTYAIEVGDSTHSNASAIFTVGTPSALVQLNPASVEQGQSVGVAGAGFNPQDQFCTISSASGNALFDLTHPVTCLIGSGYASGAFTVAPNAPGGYYLITVSGCSVAPTAQTLSSPPTCPPGDSLDFASNFLGVTLATTVTTFSTTTSSATTTTSVSTTTTSVATSFSFSSTTYSTTGIFFTTYTHFTVTTVSGQTTTVVTQTSSTTNTQTTVTFSTTTQFTTVPCGPLPCGFQTQPTPFNPAPGIDSTGLLAALLLLIPMLLRRLFT